MILIFKKQYKLKYTLILGKIIFLAPIKPLVRQQLQQFLSYVPVQSDNVVEITGHVRVEQRKKYWKEKRIFFGTPQTLKNDIKNGK